MPITEKQLAVELRKAAVQITGAIITEQDALLLSSAIFHIKSSDRWLEDDSLLGIRSRYFFEPYMVDETGPVVFLTHPLFVRDILEKKRINGYLNSPILFVSRPLAGFIFKEYTAHILLDAKKLQERNKGIKWISLGGCLMPVSNHDIDITDCVVKTTVGPDEDIKRRIDRYKLLKEMERDASLVIKAAMKTKNPETEIWEPSEHERDLPPGTRIIDKVKRTYAVVKYCEPGKNGYVEVEYAGGKTKKIRQDQFDLIYSRI